MIEINNQNFEKQLFTLENGQIVKRAYFCEELEKILLQSRAYYLRISGLTYYGMGGVIGTCYISEENVLVENGNFAGCYFEGFGSIKIEDMEQTDLFVGMSWERDDILPKSFTENCEIFVTLNS